MSIKMTGGIDAYGLRLARRQAREMMAELKGDKSAYARGWRRACTAMQDAIDEAFKKWRDTPESPPPPSGEGGK